MWALMQRGGTSPLRLCGFFDATEEGKPFSVVSVGNMAGGEKSSCCICVGSDATGGKLLRCVCVGFRYN